MSMLLIIAAAAMPLSPPGQIVKGVGSIPESRNGPIFNWKAQQISGLTWRCGAKLDDGKVINLSGHFEAFNIVPSRNGGYGWPPYTISKIGADVSHEFSGTFLATYSGNIYGLRLALHGDMHELTVRFDDNQKTGRIELRRYRHGLDKVWQDIGTGTCKTLASDADGSTKL